MKETLRFAGKVLVALLVINIIANFVGLRGIINDPLGAIGFGKPSTPA